MKRVTESDWNDFLKEKAFCEVSDDRKICDFAPCIDDDRMSCGFNLLNKHDKVMGSCGRAYVSEYFKLTDQEIDDYTEEKYGLVYEESKGAKQ